jgi:predicted DNA-binding protein
MGSPLTLRLDDDTRGRIDAIAKRRRLSTSEAVRRAIEVWIGQEEAGGSPYEGIADLIGVVRGGNARRSANAGKQLSELLKNRSRRR